MQDGWSDYDLEPVEEIQEGIDCEHDEGLFPDSPIDFASTKD